MKNRLGTIIVAILVVFVMLQIAMAAAPKDSWLSKANMPSIREGLTVTAVDGKIYAIDGYGIVGGTFVGDTNITEVYDPTTNSWTTKAPAPTKRAELTAAAHGGKIYVLGGRFVGVLTTNEIYDVAANTWSTGAPMLTARAGLASAALGNKIYAIGGRTGTAPRSPTVLNTVEVYDIATGTWTSVAALNEARSDLVAVAHGGRIYAIGGWNGTNATGTVEVYNPTKNIWTTATPMPTARSNLVADVKGNSIYAIGGLDDSGMGYLNTTEAYNIKKDTWDTKAPMPTARAEMDSARVGDKIYVIGGGIFGALIGGNVTEAYIAV